ncbi:SPX domain-containing protein [Gymnopilus junonius]|uniref:SPX domain-containing protein n=1 Tax=Gymnopilus junonius TaxID=109634 RepID=A0A9P5NFW3_GYMJU|nr:SPX domain-containing protein [Gymnopilus junonius]
MKFSSSLKFNAISEWWDQYISYDSLKKFIYQLEKQQSGRDAVLVRDIEANEHSSLLGGQHAADTDPLFIPALDKELQKVVHFYLQQEKELFEDLAELEKEIERLDEADFPEGYHYEDFDDEDEDDDESISASRSPDATRNRKRRISRARRAGAASAPHERRFSVSSSEDNMEDGDVSHRGSRSQGTLGRISNKISDLRDSIVSTSSVADRSIWTAKTDYAYDTRLLFKRRLTNFYIAFTNLKSYVEVNYAGFRKILKKYDKVTYSDLKDQYLHEKVELATPFTQPSKDRINDTLNLLIELYAKCVMRGDKAAARQQLRLHQRENIAWERDTVWRQMIGRERRGELGADDLAGAILLHGPETPVMDLPTPGAFLILIVLLNIQVVEAEPANRCFAVLIFCTVLWATEAIPLFVTSMFVPLLLVLLGIPCDSEGIQLSTKEATKFVFSIMFSPTIMLLIGGFTISSALSKTNIDRVLITKVLTLAGTRPSTVLLTFMGVSCFASMWISNVAAPTLCFSLIKPILRTLPPRATFAPCLILAIALAANIGGQSSPISSPQNLIAIEYMDNKPIGYWVTFVCIVTIGLWCIEHKIEGVVGDMGVIAIIPVVAFFSTGVLKKDDFEHFMWTIVFLAMGGIALGKGVTSSGLLTVMDVLIRRLVEGLSLPSVVLILSPIVLIISTFISHTIASVLLAPIAQEVGRALPGDQSNLLVFITGLICSCGMGMPVSGFPNQTAATQEDD